MSEMPSEPDVAGLRGRLYIRAGTSYVEDLENLSRSAQDVARPKALRKVAFVGPIGDDYVTVDGTKLTRRVLRVNLEQAYHGFSFVATCGTEKNGQTH